MPNPLSTQQDLQNNSHLRRATGSRQKTHNAYVRGPGRARVQCIFSDFFQLLFEPSERLDKKVLKAYTMLSLTLHKRKVMWTCSLQAFYIFHTCRLGRILQDGLFSCAARGILLSMYNDFQQCISLS